MRRNFRLLAILPAALLAGASKDVRIEAGLWEVVNTPGVATLDGRALSDLPLFEIETEQVCLSDAEAANLAALLPGGTRDECRITETLMAGGVLKVRGICPNEGFEDGSFRLDGRYQAGRYEVGFETTAYGDNGRMTFSGKLVGRRVGDCPA